jgi:guanine nucleotide-binding protein subunit beta-2-like 1 protein
VSQPSESKSVNFELIVCVARSIVDELKPTFDIGENSREPECVSIAWSADGQTLFGGFTDNHVRVWTVSS